jgi:hypothetical protein
MGWRDLTFSCHPSFTPLRDDPFFRRVLHESADRFRSAAATRTDKQADPGHCTFVILERVRRPIG